MALRGDDDFVTAFGQLDRKVLDVALFPTDDGREETAPEAEFSRLGDCFFVRDFQRVDTVFPRGNRESGGVEPMVLSTASAICVAVASISIP